MIYPRRMFYRSHSVRPGFSLIELLLTIGIISILIGLSLPSLRQAREKADVVACMVEMRQLSIMITQYAIDSKDYVPFVYTRDPSTGSWLAPTGRELPGPAYYATAADYWPLPMIDDFGGLFLNDALLCPNDVVTEQLAEKLAAMFQQPLELVFPPMERSISRAFYFAPQSLRADLNIITERDNRVAQLHEVKYPSRKALLVENTPFHEDSYYPATPSPVPLPYRLMVAATDGSTMLRPIVDANPSVLVDPDTHPYPNYIDIDEILRRQRIAGNFHHTRDGVYGRDW